MRILFTCGREPEYVRNEVILRALRKHFDVVEITDSRPGSLISRCLHLMPRLARIAPRQDYDLLFVGFYGYLLVPWLRKLTKRPLIFDAFVSNYDTLCFDRQQFRPNSIMGKTAFQLDRLACRLADLVLLDTGAHKQYFADMFNLDPHKLAHVYVSCNEDMFYPRPSRPADGKFRIFSYSSYLPLHGVEYIIQAAKLLASQRDIEFRLIGAGLTYPTVRQLATQLKVSNVDFVPPAPYSQLPPEIAAADLCLAGPFGQTGKAARVIPGKLFQFLAMARPTIAGNTLANGELLTHRREVYLCSPANPEALARAIGEVKEDENLRATLATAGYAHYQQQAGERVVEKNLLDLVEKVGKPALPQK